jgi:hypothetical protein
MTGKGAPSTDALSNTPAAVFSKESPNREELLEGNRRTDESEEREAEHRAK